LGHGLAQSKFHLPENALALTHSKRHAIVSPKMLTQELAIPQITSKVKDLRIASQILLQRFPLFNVQCCWTSRPLTLAHAFQPVGLESLDPALYGASIFSEQVCHLLATLTSSHKQKPVQSMVVARLIRTGNFSLDRDSDNFRVGNFQLSHDGFSVTKTRMSIY
jgi:hypothetical protein